MNKSAFISDVLFTFLIASLVTLCIFRFIGTPLLLAIILSALCGVLCACALGAFWQNKRKTILLKRSELAVKERLYKHLSLSSDEQNRQLLLNAFSASEEYTDACLERGELFTPTARIFLHFTFAPVHADDVARYFRVPTKKEKLLLCLQMDDDAFQLCRQLNITVQTGEWVYLFLKKHDALPETFLGEETTENKRARRLRLCFSKTNARRFITSALFILTLSYFTPFSTYYLLFALALLILAVCIRIFGYS